MSQGIKNGIMNNKGLTLIELVVVVTVIGILAVALGLSFQGWVRGYNVESQIKTLHADLMNTRARAMQRNRMHFIDLTATQYTIYDDNNPAPNGDGNPDPSNDAQVSQTILDTLYPITSAIARIEFDNNGLADNNNTICSNAATDTDADYDCIAISATRINIGQLTTALSNGGICNAANCVER